MAIAKIFAILLLQLISFNMNIFKKSTFHFRNVKFNDPGRDCTAFRYERSGTRYAAWSAFPVTMDKTHPRALALVSSGLSLTTNKLIVSSRTTFTPEFSSKTLNPYNPPSLYPGAEAIGD
ncbi:hypothetical protein Tco_0896544 [Tanacetum coccineum]